MKRSSSAARFGVAALLMLATPAMADRLYLDTFVGSNGSRPAAWKPVVDSGAGGWVLENSALVASAAADGSVAIITDPAAANWKDYFIQVDVWNPDVVGGIYLVGRYKDPRNFYEGGIFMEGNKPYMKIDVVKDGARKTLVRQEETPQFKFPDMSKITTYDTRKVMRMVLAGNEVGLFFEQAGLIRAVDDSLDSGAGGVGATGAAARFDNAIVDDNFRSVFVPSVLNRAVAQGAPPARPGSAPSAAPAEAAAPAIPASQMASLGQVAPAAPAGQFRVRVASGLNQDAANALQRTLQSDGYSPVDVVESGGSYIVLVGNFIERGPAEMTLADMRQSKGYSPEGIQGADEGAGQRTVSTAEAGKIFRVVVSELPSRQDAETARDSLVEDSYVGAQVIQAGSTFQVVLGEFATEPEAERLQQQLVSSGYTGARVSSAAEIGAVPAQLDTTGLANALRGMGAGQQQDAQTILELSQKVARSQASAEEIVRQRELLQNVSPEVRTAVASFQSGQGATKEDTQRLAEIFSEYGSMLVAGNWEEAEKKLAEARRIAPDDPRVDQKYEQLARMKLTFSGRAAAPSAPTPASGGGVEGIIANARRAEQDQNWTVAKQLWEQVRQEDPSNTEAAGKIAQLQQSIEKRTEDTASTGSLSTSSLVKYGVPAVVAALLVLGYFVWQNRRREAKLEAQVAALSSGKMPAVGAESATVSSPASPGRRPFAAGIAAPSATGESPSTGSSLAGSSLFGGAVDVLPVEPVEEEESKPSAPAAHEVPQAGIAMETRPPGEADVLMLDDVHTPPPSEVPSAPVTGESETLRIEGLDLGFDLPPMTMEPPSSETPTESAVDTPLPEPPPPIAAPPELSIDDLVPAGLFGDIGENQGPVGPPPMENLELPEIGQIASLSDIDALVPAGIGEAETVRMEPVLPPDGDIHSADTIVPTMAFAETVKAEPVAPATAPPTAASESNGYYYRQDFDDESVGNPPRNWLGEYDYASLVVDDSAAVKGSRACLKFEKKAGAGSANYVCTFPKASGRVIVEFDVRCDDKNKYLLGFYIERDEDFKQSVHTIVHRLDAKAQPSLRIQGEPVPYDFGTWRHVKYDLNLLSGLVNAFVDGQPILTEAKLAVPPPYVNTLSIRDNSATVGTLFLDNIMIYKG